MKILYVIAALFFCNYSFAKKNSVSKKYPLQFIEVTYGIADVSRETIDSLQNSPSGLHEILSGFEVTKVTDSVPAVMKANFGVEYMIKAVNTFDLNVDIEWKYPDKIVNTEGKAYKSIRYTSKRPTNILSASAYSLDKLYEVVKGNWKMNIDIQNKLIYTKEFMLY